MSKELEKKDMGLKDVLESYQDDFINSLTDRRIEFNAEIHFAYQALLNNDYLLSVAKQNPMSLKNAIVNIAAVGLTLNPVSQLAYLVPRTVNKKPSVCLDISYKGLLRAATESGSIEWAQAEIVYSSESCHIEQINKPPIHKRDMFSKDKGEIVGAYVVAKTSHGDYLTTHMTIDEIFEIRNKSEAFKKGFGPWRSFESEMIKKTVVKRAAKMWPRTPNVIQLEKAIDVVNEHEGIDFEAEKVAMLEDKSNIDEDFPVPEENKKLGPNFLFLWGKFRGKLVKDCDIEEMKKYLDYLNPKVEKDKKYQAGDKFRTHQVITDYVENHGLYNMKASEETLDELFSTGFEADDEYIESLTEGEARNLIEGVK